MTFGVKDLQERFAVGEHTVLGWIRSGELQAINVARTGSSRPKWRIKEEDLERFELLRAHSPPPPPKRKRRKNRNASEVEFY